MAVSHFDAYLRLTRVYKSRTSKIDHEYIPDLLCKSSCPQFFLCVCFSGKTQNSSGNLKILPGIGSRWETIRETRSKKVKISVILRYFGILSQKFGRILQLFERNFILIHMVLLKQHLSDLSTPCFTTILTSYNLFHF